MNKKEIYFGSRRFLRRAEWILFLSFCFLGFSSLFPKYQKVRKLEKKIINIEKKIDSGSRRKEEKREYLSLLKKNSKYLELIARDKLNLKMPNEKIIRFRESSK